jgi:hypothetical protein
VERVAQSEASRGGASRVTLPALTPAPRVRSLPGPVAPALPIDEAPSTAALPTPLALGRPAARPPEVALPAPTSSPPATATLSEQARELAETKRLIDAGSAAEALRRLEANRGANAPFALSEERDALYVQALYRARRRAEARLAARQFVIRYPESPYLETLRQLLAQ